MKSMFFYLTAIGEIGIAADDNAITEFYFAGNPIPTDLTLYESPLIKEAATQLTEYLAGTRTTFTFPLAPQGTPFQLAVWQALQEIPYGETRSYKDIAVRIGKPKACRAVGMANNKNPLAIFIPCHRVIGSNGKLVGYGGGLGIKEKLLAMEKNARIYIGNSM